MNSLSFRSFFALAAGASLLSLAACKEYLDVKPLSVYSTAEAFANVTNATSTVFGVYSLLEGDNGYGSRLATSIPFDADDMLNSPGEPDGGRRDIARYRMTAGTTEFQAPFTQLYQGVE
ncbi:MAG: RagB/SusD family nutrient uptake outer membrane protein, partial [Hymenobacter sp.]